MTDRFEPWMRRALALAERGGGATSPNPMVGCVLVGEDDRPLGEGWHARAGGPHAEVAALADAAARGEDARGATAVVTLEPCAATGRTGPCTTALVDAGVARVVYGARDPHLGKGGAERLREAGIEVVGGVRSEESERLNEPWLHWISTGRPFLHLKVAHTLCGHVTRGAGHPRWISGPAARTAVHRLRRRHAAILVGIGTVLADDPDLTVRDWPPAEGAEPDGPAWPDVQPFRVVLDARLRLPEDSRLARGIAPDRPVLVICAENAPAERRAGLEAAGIEVVEVPRAPAGVDLETAIVELARREITGVLVESGPTLAASLLEARLADRWTAFIAPDTAVGGDALPLYAPAGPVSLPALSDVEWHPHGADMELTGRLVPARRDSETNL